jgi:hypothetical protein
MAAIVQLSKSGTTKKCKKNLLKQQTKLKEHFMTNNSLPIGYDELRTSKPYVSFKRMTDGEHKFRIVDRPIAGWIDWKDKKPYRFRPENKPKKSFDPTKPIRAFWAMHVWDYEKEGLFVMELTQQSIIKALENLALNEEWGDITTFDFKIKKETAEIVKYGVMPVPHKPLTQSIKDALATAPVRLEALYEGKDPWTDLEETEELKSGSSLTDEQEAKLDAMLWQVKAKDIDKITASLGIDTIYDIPAKEFDRAMKWFETVLKARQGGANESESVA